jgi:alpha-N-arabinofuranosidase
MKAWKAKVWSWDIEGVSLHNYVVGGWPPHLRSTGFGEDEYAIALNEAFRMDTLITKQSAIMDKYDPEKKLALVVDEWGAWLAPTPGSNPGFLQQQNSLRDALLAAVNLNIFVRHADRVRLANIAQMINVLQAMILTDGPKMVLTPTYHIYKLYLPFQNATALPVAYEAGTYRHGKVEMPRVDAIAARDTTGRVWVSVMNLDPKASADFAVDVAGVSASSAAGEVLTADRVDAINSFTAPNNVRPRPIAARMDNGKLVVTLPPASVAVLALQ